MEIQNRPMFAKELTNAGHVQKFIIDALGRDGWEVREEHDHRVVRQTRYTDWHRVERARQVFSVRASLMTDKGWVEA